MSKCLYCYQELDEGQVDFHPSCARKFFGNDTPPILPYTRDNMTELAKQVIRTSTSVTGVQAKMSLDVNRGSKNEPARFTIVGLWGKYIFKPQSAKYPNLPELEDLTMKMAEIAHIRTARHTLIRLADGELGYLTLRMDRGRKGEKISMLDMCQLTNRLTEHKYYGTYQQLAETIKKILLGSDAGCSAVLGNSSVLLDDRQFRHALQEFLPDRFWERRVRIVASLRFAGSTTGRPSRPRRDGYEFSLVVRRMDSTAILSCRHSPRAEFLLLLRTE